MSEELKKLYMLSEKTNNAFYDAENKTAKKAFDIMLLGSPRPGIYPPKPKTIKKLQRKLQVALFEAMILRDKAEVLRKILWFSVREEFPDVRFKPVGIFKGFNVYWYEKVEEPPCLGIRGIIIGPS